MYELFKRVVCVGKRDLIFRPTNQLGIAQLYQMSDTDLITYAKQIGLI